jgi:hypothetical protein
MRRVLTTLVLAGAIAFAVPCATYAQRGGGHAGGFSGGGHAGGFSGGHVGGFSGGGFSGHSFSAPSGGFQGRSFSAPRMNFMPGPSTPGTARFASTPRPYGSPNGTRSPFGQLNIPTVRRAPYPGAANRGSANQPYHNGNNQWRGGDHDGHDHYRRPYYGGVGVYPWGYGWPYYAGLSYWPYFGNWDSGYDYSPDTSAQIAPQMQDQNPQQYPDQYSAPEPQDMSRPVYPPATIGSPGVAISEPTVTIIYKDGHAEQVRNYALTPTKLLMMDNAAAGYSMQVPLSLINLPATIQANRAVGVDFQPPVGD